MSSPVIQTADLTKRFGKNTAVDSLSLAVPEGTVFGFLGRNGAGKTTTIKMLLGLLPRTSGSASVLGLDSARKSLDIKRQVGYVPEQHHMYRWMTVDQLMWFCKAFYPTWDDAECARLLERFKLPGDKKIRQLSRGMIAKTALTLALAHDPKILILDEPTGGLDVIVRREFLESIVRLIQERGKTVFISSHLLADVERVADQVAILREGRGLLKLPLLMLENPCAHDCLFCKAKPLVPTPLDEARAWLADNREFAQPRLGLVGNEPLAHPDVDAVIAEARQCGFTRFETLTTAAPLAEPGRAEALVKAGVRTYAIPLWAADAATHDRITRSPGSHEITLRALRQLGELGADVFVHANVLQQNLGGLEALQRLVADELGLPLCLLPVRPKDANLPYAELVARYRDLIGLELSGLVAFPLCVAAQVQQPAVPPASIIADVLKVYVLDQPFVKPRKCDRCGLQKRCVGTFQAYLDLFGDGEITPA